MPGIFPKSRFERLVLFAAGVVFALGCSARQKGPNEPTAEEPWVRHVEIRGNEVLDEDDILEGLASREPTGLLVTRRTRLDPVLIERDVARIKTFYRQHGFFEIKVLGSQVLKVTDEKFDILFRVSEGPRSWVVDVDISGLPPDVDSRKALPVEPRVGDPFDYEDFDEGKTRITAALLQAGYAHAKVSGTAEVDRQRRAVALRYEVDSGPKVRFGEIEVIGLDIVPQSAVTNRLAFRTGELFHPKKVRRSQSELHALGRFGLVRIDFTKSEPSEVGDVTVAVTEAPRHEVRLGGGLGFDRDVFQIHSRAEYRYSGLFDPLTTFSTQLRPAYAVVRSDPSQGELVGEVRGSLTRDDLFWPLATGKASVRYGLDAIEAYSSRGVGFTANLLRPSRKRNLDFGLGWSLERLTFTRIDDAIDSSLGSELGFTDANGNSSPYRLGFIEESIALDLRDRPLSADEGVYASAKLEHGGPFALGEFSYGRVTGELRAYHAFTTLFGVAGRAKLGRSLWGTLPMTRRYLSGGSTTHRGFTQRHLSPVAGDVETSNIAIGGDKLLELSFEARFNLVRLWNQWLGLTLFADGGDVLLSNQALRVDDLHWAVGPGLRYDTAIGPVRFDVGYRVTRAGAGEIQSGERVAFHLSIGEAF